MTQRKTDSVNVRTIYHEVVNVLWFALDDGARERFNALAKKLGVEVIDGVKSPQVVSVERRS
jgi:hypothetical protein